MNVGVKSKLPCIKQNPKWHSNDKILMNTRIPTAEVLRYICAYIQKGEVRNTVLRQIKNLERSLNLLNQGRSIKEKEIKEYKSKKPSKARKLKRQVSIITHGLKHIIQALNELQKYKKTTSR